MTPTRRRVCVCVFKYIAHVNHIGTNMGTSSLIGTLLTRLPILHPWIRTKPSPNESTTPVLKARGARCRVLDSGSLGSVLRASFIWIGRSNPYKLLTRFTDHISDWLRYRIEQKDYDLCIDWDSRVGYGRRFGLDIGFECLKSTK